MSGLQVVEVDPRDPGSFEPWHAVYAEASRHGHGELATVWTLEEVRVSMQEESAHKVELAWSGLQDGRVVCAGWLRGSHLDNTGSAEVQVLTRPEDRGQGYAAAMLDHVERVARDLGRHLLLTEIAWGHDDVDGSGSADLRWARSHGFEVGLVDVQRRLALPVVAALLDELAAEAAMRHEGYELRTFVGPVPDDLVEDWARLSASLMTEAPMGDIEREPASADVGALRAREELLEKQGRLKLNTAALSPDGEVVAFTDLAITVHESDRAYQWGTLVRADHRGHRLGLAVKVANLRLLQETQPQVTTVVTYNAEVNSHMVGVNERVGFRPVLRLGELQKRL